MADVVDSCNVFIKYLPHEVTDSGLYAMFSPFGEVVSCKVMLDNITKNSLGYGFCRYSNPAEAQAAVEKMSGVKCGQKTLLCKLSNSSPGPNMSTNLYVKPLLATTTEADLRHLFSQFGEILECKVMTDKGVNSTKQVGFVRFANVQEATIAIKQMNGYQLDADAPHSVKYAETSPQKALRKARLIANQTAAAARHAAAYYTLQQQTQTALASMYSGNTHVLPYVITDTYGNVTYAPMSNTTVGMGFDANYPATYTPAQMAPPFYYVSPSPTEYPYPPEPAPPYPTTNRDSPGKTAVQDKSTVNNNLFVFHLPASVDDNALFALFAPFGTLQSVRVMVDPATGRSRGFGFVQYRHFSEAVRAIAGMNGYQLENKYLKVTFKTPSDKTSSLSGKPGKPKRGRNGRKGRGRPEDHMPYLHGDYCRHGDSPNIFHPNGGNHTDNDNHEVLDRLRTMSMNDSTTKDHMERNLSLNDSTMANCAS